MNTQVQELEDISSWGEPEVAVTSSISSRTDYQNYFIDLPKEGEQIQFRPLVKEDDALFRKNVAMHRFLYGIFHGVPCTSHKQTIEGKSSLVIDPFCEEAQNAIRFYFKKIENYLIGKGENLNSMKQSATLSEKEDSTKKAGSKKRVKTKEYFYQNLVYKTAMLLSEKTKDKTISDLLKAYNKANMKKAESLFYFPIYDFGSDSVKIFTCKWSVYRKILDELEDGKYLINSCDMVLRNTGKRGADYWSVKRKEATPLSQTQTQMLENKRPELLKEYAKLIEPKSAEDINGMYLKFHTKRLLKTNGALPEYPLPAIVSQSNGVKEEQHEIPVQNLDSSDLVQGLEDDDLEDVFGKN